MYSHIALAGRVPCQSPKGGLTRRLHPTSAKKARWRVIATLDYEPLCKEVVLTSTFYEKYSEALKDPQGRVLMRRSLLLSQVPTIFAPAIPETYAVLFLTTRGPFEYLHSQS